MKPFEYLEPRDLAEACKLLSEHKEEAKIIAGGQSLVPMLKQRLITPQYVINIKGLTELDYIKDDHGGMKLGALTTHRAIETSPLIKERFPILVEMERQLGIPHVKNWGTIGGSLSHADPASDLGPVLIALAAKAKAKSKKKEREIALDDFFVDYLESVLEPDEILVEIEIPKPAANSAGVYIKDRVSSADMAIVSVAVMVTMDGETVKSARIVLGSAGATPIRAKEAEKALVGKKAAAVLEEVGAAAASEADPPADVHGSSEYKRGLIQVHTKSAVSEAVKRVR